MFYFGTPFLSKAAAVDWETSVALLNGALAAVAQQTDRRFHHLIACHDIPEIAPEFQSFVTFLPVDTPIPRELPQMRLDKGHKKRRIAAHLRELGGGYLMFLDADDLVHRRLVEHALTASDPHGYLVKDGYMLYRGAQRIMRLQGDFDDQCGSCGIFRFAPDDLPRAIDDQDNYFSSFHSHRTWGAHAQAQGRPLAPVPFPAVIYLRSPNISISGRFFPEIGRRALKKKLKQWLYERPLDEEIRRDFAL